MERHESELMEKAIEAAKKKFEKDNIKAETDGDVEKKSAKWLKERLEEITDEFEELAKERKSRKVEPRKNGWCFSFFSIGVFFCNVRDIWASLILFPTYSHRGKIVGTNR